MVGGDPLRSRWGEGVSEPRVNVVKPVWFQHGDYIHDASQPCYECGTITPRPRDLSSLELLNEAKGLLREAAMHLGEYGDYNLSRHVRRIQEFLKKAEEVGR